MAKRPNQWRSSLVCRLSAALAGCNHAASRSAAEASNSSARTSNSRNFIVPDAYGVQANDQRSVSQVICGCIVGNVGEVLRMMRCCQEGMAGKLGAELQSAVSTLIQPTSNGFSRRFLRGAQR